MATHMHVHYTHVYVLMCAVNVYTCKHMCMVYALRVCMYVCTHVCVHACTVFACMCVYVCVPYECTHACAWKLPVSWPLLDLHSNRLWTQTIRYLKGATSVTASPHAPPHQVSRPEARLVHTMGELTASAVCGFSHKI